MMRKIPSLDECVVLYNNAFNNPFDAEHKISKLTSPPALGMLHARLGEHLPQSLIVTIEKYDFSSLSVGQVIFEYGQNYKKLVEANRLGPLAWWRSEVRPPGQLMVAQTTGWTILVSCNDDEVLAFETCSDSVTALQIAPDFDLFFRLCCMIAVDASWLVESTQIPSSGPAEVRFWEMLARGFA